MYVSGVCSVVLSKGVMPLSADSLPQNKNNVTKDKNDFYPFTCS